ncbi:MFS general substrate transporter [Xylariaceae sp. FL0016]|nr:MFS general substrate transporter [Xylariaceae sp. FL0016]
MPSPTPPEHRSLAADDVALFTEETPLLPSDDDPSCASERPTSTHPDDLNTPNQKVSRSRAIGIMISVYVLIFLQASNMSGMTMVQSVIAADLDAYENAMWFTTSFLVALSSMAPLTGKLATIFSPRAMVLVSSVLFATGCLITSQARSFLVFILGRIICGLGGGGTMVLAFILVLELTTKRNRGIFIGLTNAGFTTGVSLGAVFFGGLVSTTGWRALFWIQTPLSLLAGSGVFFSIPSSFTSGQTSTADPWSTKLKRIDYLGAFFLATTIVLFLFGLSGNIRPAPLATSLGTLVLFLLIERYLAVDPIVPLTILRNRGALLSCFSQLGFMAARWTVLFYSPITALAVRGFQPAASGSILIPTNLGFGIGGLLVGWLHIRRSGSFYLPSLLCFGLFGISLLALSFASTPGVPMWLYVAIVFLNGLFTGGALNYTLAHLLHLTLPETHYVATSLLGTFRGFAGSFGSAIGGGIFVRTLRGSLEKGFQAIDRDDSRRLQREELIRKLIGSPAMVFNGGLDHREQAVAVQGYVDALRVLFQAAVALIIVVVAIQAATGWSGHGDKLKDHERAAGNSTGEDEGELQR